MKTCGECGLAKPRSEYYKRSRSKDQLDRKCKTCAIAKVQAWRLSNPERLREVSRAWSKGENGQKARRKALLKKYGMTLETYERKLQEQGGGCAVCGGTNGGRMLFIDHDHLTGATRDLLCGPCNSALGLLKESIPQLEALIAYLRKHSLRDVV